jgi:hypothetical protein
VGIVNEVVMEETSKVFWDQSRAGYPRFISQKCSNRHGLFLTVEEFEGTRGAAPYSFQRANMGKVGLESFRNYAWQVNPFMWLKRKMESRRARQ